MRHPHAGTERPLILAWLLLAAATVHGEDYAWRLPPGFPPPPVPVDNPMSVAKVQLGCQLFFDPRLSINGTHACASCHQPALAYTDGRTTSIGATGETVRRNAMSLANVAYRPALTWADPAPASLERQMRTPLFGLHPLEMGMDEHVLPAAVREDRDYAQAFDTAFPGETGPMSVQNTIRAIASFERTLVFGRSPFDRYVFDDERDALSAEARRGMALFYSERTGCSGCHSGLDFSGPLSTARDGPQPALHASNGLYDLDGHGAYPPSDTGLMEHTHARRDMGRFKVPTLRNVALTAPYMHDGSIATLEAVLDHYAKGVRRDARLRPLSLDAGERAALLAFLRSLTDEAFAGAAQPPAGPRCANGAGR